MPAEYTLMGRERFYAVPAAALWDATRDLRVVLGSTDFSERLQQVESVGYISLAMEFPGAFARLRELHRKLGSVEHLIWEEDISENTEKDLRNFGERLVDERRADLYTLHMLFPRIHLRNLR